MRTRDAFGSETYVKLTRRPRSERPSIARYSRTGFPLFDGHRTLSAGRTRIHSRVSSAGYTFQVENIVVLSNHIVIRFPFSICHSVIVTCVVTRTARVPRRPTFKSAVDWTIDIAPFFQRIRPGMVSAKPFWCKTNVYISREIKMYTIIQSCNNSTDKRKRKHYRSVTVLPSLLSQYTAPTVIPSPHGLPPRGKHDTFVMVFHEYLKQVKFKWHGCVCIAIGQLAPVVLWLLSNNLVRCCSCDDRQSWKTVVGRLVILFVKWKTFTTFDAYNGRLQITTYKREQLSFKCQW